jgi:hypothetical protein
MPTQILDTPPRNASIATIKEKISDLKFRAGRFLSFALLNFLIPEQIRGDLLRDQIHNQSQIDCPLPWLRLFQMLFPASTMPMLRNPKEAWLHQC